MSCYGRRGSSPSSSSYWRWLPAHRCLTVMAAWTQDDKQNGRESWISHFPQQDVWPRGHKHTHRAHMRFNSHAHTHTQAIKSNGVCPVAGRESPLMSGSHNDIIAVDGACWGILFHTIGMLQTSTRTTHRRWWQKSVLTPDLLVDAFDKKPQHVDSSPRQENCSYFQLKSGFMCFFSTKTDIGDRYQRGGAVLLPWAFEIQGRQLYHLLEILSYLKYSLLWIKITIKGCLI